MVVSWGNEKAKLYKLEEYHSKKENSLCLVITDYLAWICPWNVITDHSESGIRVVQAFAPSIPKYTDFFLLYENQ